MAQPPSDEEPLLPIARALKESIDAKLVDGESPLDVDDAWNAAVQRVAEEIIAERLRELDPERVLRLYADAAGDAALKQKLGVWAAAKADDLERGHAIEQLRDEGARTGAVDLTRLDAGEHIGLGLFDPHHLSEARKEGSLPPARTIALRLVDPQSGAVELIADTALRPSPGGALPQQARGRIGCLITEGPGDRLEPRLQVHAPLGYDFGEGPKRTTEVIGFAEVGRGRLVLDGGGPAR